MQPRLLLLTIALMLGGCRGCKNDHPYVPYAIGDGAPDDADTSKLVVASDDDGGAFLEQPAEKAPANATQWQIGGLKVDAPTGSVFELGLAKDLDGDGAADVIAITRAAEKSSDPGTLVFYKSTAQGLAPSLTAIATGPLPGDIRCSVVRRLAQVGKRSVLIELTSKCPVVSSHDPSRWVAVVAFTPAPRVHFSASVVDPPGAPSLFFNVEGSDRDGDGIDDVSVRVSIEGGGAPMEPLPRTTAVLGWFDRPAGMSRNSDDPDGSLRSLAGVAQALAGKIKDAPSVPPRVRAIRALYSALCNDGGAPRLTRVLGDSALSCGSSRALEEAGLAEVRAYATMGDALLATTSLARAQIAPATKTANRTKDGETWILQAAPLAVATSVRQVAAVPLIERGRQPAWGALAFESSGKLLVRTAAGVVRMDPDTGDEGDARDVAPWSMAVVSPDGGSRFIEAYNACDGVLLHATLAPTADGDMADVDLPIFPVLGSHCATAKGEPVGAIPIAWGAGGLETIVDGFPVLVSASGRASVLQSPMNQPVSLGSPRSPDGKTLIVATPLGLVVRGFRTRMLRAAEFDGAYGELRDCGVSDDGLRAACVRAGHAWVGMWPQP